MEIYSWSYVVIESDGVCSSTGDPSVRRVVSRHRNLAKAVESLRSVAGPNRPDPYCIVDSRGRKIVFPN